MISAGSQAQAKPSDLRVREPHEALGIGRLRVRQLEPLRILFGMLLGHHLLQQTVSFRIHAVGQNVLVHQRFRHLATTEGSERLFGHVALNMRLVWRPREISEIL